MAPIVRVTGDGVFLVGDDPARIAWAAASPTAKWVFIDGDVHVIDTARGRRPRTRARAGSLNAPMPATVRKINVAVGNAVTAGEVLIVLEAMKMELPVRAPAAGIVTAVLCAEGDLVQPGAALATLDEQ